MKTSDMNEHLSAERLQAFLEGDLPVRERGLIEEHLAACARCSVESDSWRVLFEDLAGLGVPRPRSDFADRVMAAVHVPGRVPLAARLGRRLESLLPSPRPAHIGGDALQDFVEGLLPARRMARIEQHLSGCGACAGELRAWRAILGELSELEGFSPRDGFGDRVMAAVRVRAAAPVAATRPAWSQGLAWGRRLAPRTRRAWAALSGVAVTPAVSVGLLFYTVFSHPTLTLQGLASFALWKLNDLGSLAWGGLLTVGPDAGRVLGLGSVLEMLFDAPFMVAAGALAYSAMSVLALRLLYKNLTGNRRYARISVS